MLPKGNERINVIGKQKQPYAVPRTTGPSLICNLIYALEVVQQLLYHNREDEHREISVL